MSWFAVASWTAWALCSLAAGLLRGRLYGTFLAVVLGLYTLIGVAVLPHVHAPLPLLWFLHGCAYLQWLSLIAPSMRPAWFRWGVSLPGLYTSAGVLLAFPWAISIALGLPSWGVELPFVLAAVGLVQSLSARVEVNRILVGGGPAIEGIQRVAPLDSSSLAPSTGSAVGASGGARRELKLVQLTDTHLGPFMPVERLAGVCRRAVEADPDLVLLTGDFLTMESQSDPRYLTAALAPLRALEGRVFACLGNHDHEAPDVVFAALASAGVRLLVDDAELIETRVGPVQIVGFDFVSRNRAEHMRRVCEHHPREAGALRLALLHDPGAFKHLPPGEADLVLSGHTHGGQLGLVSLRLPWTVVSWIGKIPDHGLWGRGSDRLYVHRGTGHYGFPLRLGVPAEESVLLVHYDGWTAAS